MSPPDPEWTRRYEALRAHTMGVAPLDFVPLSLAVLWHRGVAAWMAAECAATDAGLGAERNSGASPLAARDELGMAASELVRLLAGTALLVARRRVS